MIKAAKAAAADRRRTQVGLSKEDGEPRARLRLGETADLCGMMTSPSALDDRGRTPRKVRAPSGTGAS